MSRVPAPRPSVGGANHCVWIEDISCVVSVKNAGVVTTDQSEIAEIPFMMEDTGFNLRWVTSSILNLLLY